MLTHMSVSSVRSPSKLSFILTQVSVRKAALGAAAQLLRTLPGEAALAALWVRAALPAVRDTEASLQELLLDQVHLSRARAIGLG